MSRIYKRRGSPYWWYTAGTPPHRVKKSTEAKDKKVAIRIQAKWDQEIALQRSGIEVATIDLQIPFRQYIDQVMSNKGKKQAQCIKSALNVFMGNNILPHFYYRNILPNVKQWVGHQRLLMRITK